MSTKVVTGTARLSYPHLFEKRKTDDGTPGKYECLLMVPKTDTATYEKLRAAEKAAAEAGKASKFGGKIPGNLASIIKDGDLDAEDYPERAGHWLLSVRSASQPGIVDRQVRPILDPTEVYAGCYVRAALNAFPYNFNGKKGVSFALDHIQKMRDGEPFASVTSAEDVFDAVEDDADDLL